MTGELGRKEEPVFEGIANRGVGVFDTLKAVAKEVLLELRKNSGGCSPSAGKAGKPAYRATATR